MLIVNLSSVLFVLVVVCLCYFMRLYSLLMCRFYYYCCYCCLKYLCFVEDAAGFLHGFPVNVCLFLYFINFKILEKKFVFSFPVTCWLVFIFALYSLYDKKKKKKY